MFTVCRSQVTAMMLTEDLHQVIPTHPLMTSWETWLTDLSLADAHWLASVSSNAAKF